MITLVRGKNRKSVFFEMLYKNTDKPLMIIYGRNMKPHHLLNISGSFIYHRKEESFGDLLELESDLNELMAQLLASTEGTYYKTVFIYGNFDPVEIGTLKNLAHKLSEFYSFAFTIQDNQVPDGQIVFEETR